MNTFYHFTALAFLPQILREGISRGELPLLDRPFADRPQFPNLTKCGDPNRHAFWNASIFDKTRVRLEVDPSALTIRSFEELFAEFGMPTSFVRTLAPKNEHLTWYHSMTTIAVSSIQKVEVALERPGNFKVLRREAMESLCAHVELHYNQHITPVGADGRTKFKSPRTAAVCWLLDSEQYRKGPCYRPLPKNWRKQPT